MVLVRATEPPPSRLKMESLAYIDMTTLSQSELHALSLCSDAAFDLRRTDDVVIPQIDRTLFNESAGSRRQTYSRLRPAAGHRTRLPGLLPNPRPPPAPAHDDHERAENKFIVNFLKQLVAGDEIDTSKTGRLLLSPPPPLPPQPVVSADAAAVPEPMNVDTENMQIVLYSGERKRKRGRKPKAKIPDSGGGDARLEIVDKNGRVVDIKALENGDDLVSEELRRRTVGLETEEDFLGFLRGLEGQWGSRRKKRKIVDAAEFCDSLPVGWKLLLGLKRREGRVSVYCRRYISPSGQQFISCKEASSYLESYFGLNDASQPLELTGGNNLQVYGVTSENHAGLVDKNDDVNRDTVTNSTLPSSSMPRLQEIELSLMEIDNLPEVQVRDLFECHKCNMTFDEKNTYLNHLMSFHQRTTRRYKLGPSIGEGVIIKDGKYECQICHKVFQERRSYNGHVGIHVRNNARSSEPLPGWATVQKITESPSQDGLPPRISKMDALIEIAQSSILETSTAEPNDKANDGSSLDTLKVVNISETFAANSDHELSLGSDPDDETMEGSVTKNAEDQVFNQLSDMCVMTDMKRVYGDHISHVESNLNVICGNTLEHPEVNEVQKHGNGKQEIGLGNCQLTSSHNAVMATSGQLIEPDILQNGVPEFSMPRVQSLHSLPSFTAISNKGEDEFCTVDQKLDGVTGFDELRLDDIESLKFSNVNGQESQSLQEVSMNLDNDEGMEVGFNSSVRFATETVLLNISSRRQFTTVCVWCTRKFNHEAVDSETQSDSVGFMCPACKAKISGQLNVLDGGLSMNSHL